VNVDTIPTPPDNSMPLLGTRLNVNFGRGDKLFELSNHLGNVLVTVNDKKLGISLNNTTIDHFNPQVESAQDYYPYGMVQPGRGVNLDGYRYGFNGQEKSDEVANGSTTALFWEYDSRIGRRWNVDPKPNVGVSGYNTFGGNPIWFSDILGDTTGGNNTKSADRMVKVIQTTFPDNKALTDLFKLDDNKLDFAHIDEGKFASAIKDMSLDEQVLAYGYFTAVNSTVRHSVEILDRNEKYSSIAEDFITIIKEEGDVTTGKGSDFDLTGGGYNSLNPYKPNETYTVLLMKTESVLEDYVSNITGQAMAVIPSIQRLSAHELLGHSIGRMILGSITYENEDAIQMENAYSRARSGLNAWRNGTKHHKGEELDYGTANGIPSYIIYGLYELKKNQTHIRPR